jgi:hypothetical protein
MSPHGGNIGAMMDFDQPRVARDERPALSSRPYGSGT